jgi:hypothetical protein
MTCDSHDFYAVVVRCDFDLRLHLSRLPLHHSLRGFSGE